MAAAAAAEPPPPASSAQEAFLRLAKYPLVAASDMGGDVRADVLDICTAALERYSAAADRDKATQAIADALGRRYGGPWHVVVGQDFHYTVTHEASGRGVGEGGGAAQGAEARATLHLPSRWRAPFPRPHPPSGEAPDALFCWGHHRGARMEVM